MVGAKKIKHNTGGGAVPARGEVWWSDFIKFKQMEGGKGRPVVIFSVDGDFVYVKHCTTKPEGLRSRMEILSPIEAGLDEDSYVIDELIKMPRKNLTRKLGNLCEEDKDNLGL